MTKNNLKRTLILFLSFLSIIFFVLNSFFALATQAHFSESDNEEYYCENVTIFIIGRCRTIGSDGTSETIGSLTPVFEQSISYNLGLEGPVGGEITAMCTF